MNQNFIKRYSLLEIALLAIFSIGLFCASLIVELSRKILLSPPFSLPDSGLMLSLPTGDQWDSSGSWQLKDDNSLNLIFEHMGYRQKDIQVRWRYVLASEPYPVERLLGKHAESMNAEIEDVLRTSGSYPMHYTRFQMPERKEGFEGIIGILPLDYGRRIELHVRSYHPLDDMYERIFFALAENLTYEIPETVQRGIQFFDSFAVDPSVFSETQESEPSAFIIKDQNGRNLGYSVVEQSGSRFQANFFDVRNQRRETTLWFRQWPHEMLRKTKVFSRRSRNPLTFNIRTDSDKTMTITAGSGPEQTLVYDHFILPDILLNDFAKVFLESADDPICIDTQDYRGRILPIQISKIDVERAHRKNEQIASVVRIEYLYLQDSFEEIFFDASQQVIGKYVQEQNRIRMWEKTTVDQLQQLFQDSFQQSAAPVAWFDIMNLIKT